MELILHNICLNKYIIFVFKGVNNMAVNLNKSEQPNITDDNSKILIGLSWDLKSAAEKIDFDLDTSIFLLDKNGKTTNERDLIFYHNLIHPSGAIRHTGDNQTGNNQTGKGNGFDEIIMIDLDLVPDNINKMICAVTIYDGDKRNQNFGQIKNAFVSIIDQKTCKEKIHFNLREDFSIETALVVAEICRYNNEWRFNAIGSGYSGGLNVLCTVYNLPVSDFDIK